MTAKAVMSYGEDAAPLLRCAAYDAPLLKMCYSEVG